MVFAQITAEERAHEQEKAKPTPATEAAVNECDQEMADAYLREWIAENPLVDYYVDEPASPPDAYLAVETASVLDDTLAGERASPMADDPASPPEAKAPFATPTE